MVTFIVSGLLDRYELVSWPGLSARAIRVATTGPAFPAGMFKQQKQCTQSDEHQVSLVGLSCKYPFNSVILGWLPLLPEGQRKLATLSGRCCAKGSVDRPRIA